ncbi:hypothetical protein ACWDT6_29835, partial [Nocardia grenadensis]
MEITSMSVTRRTDASGVDTLMDPLAYGAPQCDSCLFAPPPAGRASTLSGPRKLGTERALLFVKAIGCQARGVVESASDSNESASDPVIECRRNPYVSSFARQPQRVEARLAVSASKAHERSSGPEA